MKLKRKRKNKVFTNRFCFSSTQIVLVTTISNALIATRDMFPVKICLVIGKRLVKDFGPRAVLLYLKKDFVVTVRIFISLFN